MTLDEINQLSMDEAYALFETCCVAPRWINQMVASRPFSSRETLLSQAKLIWQGLNESDFIAAFEGHPQIGDVSTLREKYANTAAEAGHEQAGMAQAEELVLEKMMRLNREYLKKFGFIFIVCASGKSAEEMLTMIAQRIGHQREQELTIAAKEQEKITQIRLEKLL